MLKFSLLLSELEFKLQFYHVLFSMLNFFCIIFSVQIMMYYFQCSKSSMHLCLRRCGWLWLCSHVFWPCSASYYWVTWWDFISIYVSTLLIKYNYMDLLYEHELGHYYIKSKKQEGSTKDWRAQLTTIVISEIHV